jgi:hypothetical protein
MSWFSKNKPEQIIEKPTTYLCGHVDGVKINGIPCKATCTLVQGHEKIGYPQHQAYLNYRW